MGKDIIIHDPTPLKPKEIIVLTRKGKEISLRTREEHEDWISRRKNHNSK